MSTTILISNLICVRWPVKFELICSGNVLTCQCATGSYIVGKSLLMQIDKLTKFQLQHNDYDTEEADYIVAGYIHHNTQTRNDNYYSNYAKSYLPITYKGVTFRGGQSTYFLNKYKTGQTTCTVDIILVRQRARMRTHRAYPHIH